MKTLVKLPVSSAVYDYIKGEIIKRGAPDLIMENYIDMSEIALVRIPVLSRTPNPRCSACNGTGYLRTNAVLGPALKECGCKDTGRRDDEA